MAPRRPLADTRLEPLKELHVEYDALHRATDKIDSLRRNGRIDSKARCATLSGPTGAGKTRLIDTYVEECNAGAAAEGIDIPPVRKFLVPAKCSPTNLNALMLNALGAPVVNRERVTDATLRVCNGIAEDGWELIILDEAQHLIRHGTPKDVYQVADHVKTLLDAAKCPILLVGLDNLHAIFDGNPQLKRRTKSRITIPAFDWKKAEQRNEFRAILREFDEVLPFKRRSGLDDPELAARLNYASGGVIGQVARILIDASEIGLAQGAQSLTRKALAEAYNDYRLSGEGRKFNPFGSKPLPDDWRPRDDDYGTFKG